MVRTLVVGYRSKNVKPVIDILLADAGYELEIVRTLDAAITSIERRPDFDLVILFLCLPDAPGLDAFREIYPRLPETPIVMISPTADDRTAYQALAQGAQDFLIEGEFDGQTLVRSMVFACARHAYRQVRREVDHLKAQVEQMSEQLARIHESYRELLGSISALNQRIAQRGDK